MATDKDFKVKNGIVTGGNVGISVTPNGSSKLEIATGTGAFNAVQARFNSANFPISFGIANANGFPYLGFNTRQAAGTDVQNYDLTGFASRLDANNGGFGFSVAASGTSGTSVTFTQAMKIDSTGNVGIGTSSPIFQLDIQGTGGSPVALTRFNNSPSSTSLSLQHSRGAIVGSNVIVQNSDLFGSIVFAGANGTSFDVGAMIRAEVDGVPGATADMPGRLMFLTTPDGSGASQERVRIDSNGNVGIGATSPVRKLHVATTIANIGEYAVVVEGAQGGYGAGISFQSRLTTSNVLTEMGKLVWDGEAAWSSSGLATQNSGARLMVARNGAIVEALKIDSTGNVLVGVTAPVASGANTTASATFAKAYNWFAVTNSVYVQRSDNTDGSVMQFLRGANTVGGITVTATATAFNTSSDARLKENIVGAGPASAIVNSVQVRAYNFKSEPTQTIAHGFIAQELNALVPGAVHVGDSDPEVVTEGWAVDYSKLVPVLTKALQEALARITTLEARVAALQK